MPKVRAVCVRQSHTGVRSWQTLSGPRSLHWCRKAWNMQGWDRYDVSVIHMMRWYPES